ncbi:hypothetical protein MK805_09810 [Shimazuella sp. AN120528]|uniref:hypothetical protein n=1 Tax=Shimazuella soli TaxID=1892854 RepID=UPI001F0FBB85|nr:hypothetical protein [Shimazuella soli]MCH5585264.1 hypothetical protein [Shimazuella soli]
MASRSLNATERIIKEDGKEVPVIMPAYVRDGKVRRLPDPEDGVEIYVEAHVYDIASKERSDLLLVK